MHQDNAHFYNKILNYFIAPTPDNMCFIDLAVVGKKKKTAKFDFEMGKQIILHLFLWFVLKYFHFQWPYLFKKVNNLLFFPWNECLRYSFITDDLLENFLLNLD